MGLLEADFPWVIPQRTPGWARGCLGPWCGCCTPSTGRAPVHTHTQAVSDVTYNHWHWSYWSPGWWSSFAKMKGWAHLHPPPPLCPLMSVWFCIGGLCKHSGFLLHLANGSRNTSTVRIQWSISCRFQVALSLGGIKFNLGIRPTWSETSWISS